MSNTLWFSGGPASGKTTIAGRIARRHGLRLYSADTLTWEHRDRALAAGNAAAQRWEDPTPAEMLAMSLHRERGAMVLAGLRALPPEPPVLSEVTPLAAPLPDVVVQPARRLIGALSTA